MKIDFTNLQSEPLIYFLLHSSVFVTVLGVTFFLIGVMFGGMTWRRFKARCAVLEADADSLHQEIGTLKRRLAEQALRPVTGPLAPPPALLTEVLPSAADIFPERQVIQRQPMLSPPVTKPAVAASVPEAPEQLPSPLLPELKEVPAGAFDVPAHPIVDLKPVASRIQDGLRLPELLGVPSRPLPSEPPAVEPFSFLMGDEPEPEPETATAETVPPPPVEETKEPAKTSALTGLLLPPPLPGSAAGGNGTTLILPAIPSVIPEEDPKLGWIYREPPSDVDNLLLVKGISQVFQTRLNNLGVFTFHQIAQWTESQVQEFSILLAFKDRITREKWVEQARDLEAKKKHPTPN